MIIMKKAIRLVNSKITYYLFTALVFVTVFCLLGERGYLLWKDSPAYLAFDGRTGIVPVYPILLQVNRMIFGEESFLYAVVAEQTILTVICILAFTEFIRKRFRLSYLASYPVLLFSIFMPFTTNYPLSISNHDIMTEALAYPIFYLYMICFLKCIFDKKYKDIVLMVLMSVILALIRTQLQLVGVFNAAAFIYISWMKGRKYPIGRQLVRGVCYVLLSAMVLLAGEIVILGANSAGQRLIAAMNRELAGKEMVMSEEEKPEEKEVIESEVEAEPEEKEVIEPEEETKEELDLAEGMKMQPETSSAASANPSGSNVTDQYGHLLIDKAVYEIDEDDYLLFEDEELQKLCKEIYEESDEKHQRYVYARDDLWMWQDIMDGIASGTAIAGAAWDKYLAENPDTELTYSAVNQIAAVLLMEHLGRAIYHTLRMMPQGFICTVFFQKEGIYLLCHLITLLIYVSATLLVVWGYRRKDLENQYPEFLLGCIVINVCFVLIQSVMFFAMQRYLVYCFGIFYAAYYLILKEAVRRLWLSRKKYDILSKNEGK